VDSTTAAAIVALFAPLIVSLVKQTGLSSSANGFIAIALYLIFGALAVVVSGLPFTTNNFVQFSVIFTTVGTAAYYGYWKNTGLEAALTSTTSIIKAPAAPLG